MFRSYENPRQLRTFRPKRSLLKHLNYTQNPPGKGRTDGAKLCKRTILHLTQQNTGGQNEGQP